ncbi:MAG: putative metal-binding motif-containing protein [Deltaproteobacteria bacterium]|nr:putative metal-binding motif-containing protein [Deltaproteobacteria bacterium]
MKIRNIALLVGLGSIAGGGACNCAGCEDEVVPGADTGVVADSGPTDAVAADQQGFDWTGVDLTGRDLYGYDLPPRDATGLDGGSRDWYGIDTIGLDLGTNDAAPLLLDITDMMPTAGYRGLDVVVTLVGTGIRDGAEVRFVHQDPTIAAQTGGTEVIVDGMVNATGTAIQVLFPALDPITDRPPGPYTVTVTNPAGSPDPLSDDAPVPYIVTVVPPPVVDDVTPTSAYAGSRTDGVLSDRAVSVLGSNFAAVPDVMWIDVNHPNRIYHAADVSYLSDTQVSAVVPSESQAMPPGYYNVFLQNPDGQGAYWMVSTTVYLDGGASFVRRQRGLFEITTDPPPLIDSIAPQRPQSTELNGEFHVVGSHFDPNDAVVELLIPVIDGEPIPCLLPELAAPTTPDSASDLFRDLSAAPGCGIGQGSVVAVRVTNPDGQFAIYYSMVVTPSSQGHLSEFCNYREFDRNTCPSVSPGSPWVLQTGRARHDSALGFDDLQNAYVYVVGGEGSGGVSDYLASVEAAAITPFGLPGAFGYLMQTDPAGPGERTANDLKTARKNHQVVRVQNFIFVIGGTVDDSGQPKIDATVERARILGMESIPGFSGVGYLDANGSLPPGAWYYRVAAVTSEGEGLASRELIARTDQQGSVQLSFEAYPDALFYMIYRSLASDGRAQSSRLIAASAGDPSGSFVHFTDTGVGPLAPAPGRLTAAGATGGTLIAGLYGYRVAAHVPDGSGGWLWTRPGYQVAAEVETSQNAVNLRWEAVPDADEYRLYRTARNDERGLANLLNTGSAITALQFTDTGYPVDTGTPALDAAAPLPRGSLTLFSTLPSNMDLNLPREGAEAFVLDVPDWNPPGSGAPAWHSYIYVVAGRSDRTGAGTYEETTERTEVALTTDPAQPPTYRGGDLLGWEYQVVSGTSDHLLLNTGRAFFGLITNAGSHSNPVPPDIVDPCAVPDRDGDGYRRIECGGTDCNDDDPTIHPGAPDPCGDGIDQNCDGKDPECLVDGGGYDRTGTDLARPDTAGTDRWRPDAAGTDQWRPDAYHPRDAGPCATPEQRDRDGDGYDSIECGGTDCDDTNRNINPGIEELCWPTAGMCENGIDEDCDGSDIFCCGGFTAPPDPSEVLIDANEPVFVTVLYGSDARNGNAETLIEDGAGRATWETSFVNLYGDLMGWTINDVNTSSYSAFLGLEGLLYYNYLFVMPGMAKNGQLGGNIARFPTCPPGARSQTNEACPLPEPDPYDVEVDLYRSYQSTSKANLTPRTFFSVERAYSRMFVCGGYSAFGNNTQTGTVTASCEQAQQ